ncbi:2-hydroxyacid dehydrogenase [Amphibiibacter pelophylacis]|uniref:Glyoxylate/hydroxypyruvate reductase A n=1 Tax=Amphibiibacter pelophylacis TaxID=1799477 RepID=A0ACC6NYY8_9BURK
MTTIYLCGTLPQHDVAIWQDALRQALPGNDWVFNIGDQPWPALDSDAALRSRIDIALVANPSPAQVAQLAALPHLRLIQSLWAGVEKLTSQPDWPRHIPLARMVDPRMTQAMAQTAVWAVLSLHRDFFGYQDQQAQRQWLERQQPLARNCPVTVLGAGELGLAVARQIASLGYPVRAWSRAGTRQISWNGQQAVVGEPAAQDLDALLADTRIAINLLPLTAQTRGFYNAARLAALPQGASLINLARGGHVIDDDLLAALDNGHLHRAVLDVFNTEPLPQDHRYWTHPRVTVLPHIAAKTSPETGAELVASNVAASRSGQPLQHQVEWERGY